MTSILQRILDALGGWSRRREEREREFVAANTSWSRHPSKPAVTSERSPIVFDREGLQAAYLDQSGRIAYFLDTETGEVVDSRDGSGYEPPRFRRVPSRGAAAEEADRRAFVELLEPSPARDRLSSAPDAAQFRDALSGEQALERTWYVFRNDRAWEAIEVWLGEIRDGWQA